MRIPMASNHNPNRREGHSQTEARNSLDGVSDSPFGLSLSPPEVGHLRLPGRCGHMVSVNVSAASRQ